MRIALVLSGAFLVLAALDPAHAGELLFYPAKQLRAYELDATRGVYSAVVQNVAIRNDGKSELTVAEVELALTSGGAVYETRTLRTAELQRMAAAGAQLAPVLGMLAFQFGGTALLPEGTQLATTPVLKPGQALLIAHQTLAWSGKREALRVRAQTSGGAIEGTLSITSELSRTAFALPFAGTWYDGAGASLHTHHRWVVPQEFAHDFMRIGANGLAYRGDGTKLADYYAYGEPVLAAAAGKVVAVLGDEPEDASLLQRAGESQLDYLKRIVERQNTQLARGARGIVGNHVLLQHGDGEHSLYAHLKPGSVAVKVGDTVTQGQRLAVVGSSGSSTEPHLHFHVCDAPDVLVCVGIPARFENVEIYGALEPRQMQSGDLVRTRLPVESVR